MLVLNNEGVMLPAQSSLSRESWGDWGTQRAPGQGLGLSGPFRVTANMYTKVTLLTAWEQNRGESQPDKPWLLMGLYRVWRWEQLQRPSLARRREGEAKAAGGSLGVGHRERKLWNQQSLQRNTRARNKREEIKAAESLGTAKGNKKGILQIYQGKEILESRLGH